MSSRTFQLLTQAAVRARTLGDPGPRSTPPPLPPRPSAPAFTSGLPGNRPASLSFAASMQPRRKLSVTDLGRTLSQGLDPRDVAGMRPELSRATGRARTLSTGTPLFERVPIEKVPDDGNCFMHSLARLGGPRMRDHLGLPPATPLKAPAIRAHMTSHLIGRFSAFNADAGKASAKSPWLLGLEVPDNDDPPLDFSRADVQDAFFRAVGVEHIAECADLSDQQKTHVLHMATNRSWHSETGDLHVSAFDHRVGDVMPAIAASAFPGLRLAVITPHTTSESLDVHGEGDGPPMLLQLNQRHYDPVVWPQ